MAEHTADVETAIEIDASACTCNPDVCFSEAEPVVCGYCSTADPELPCPIADATSGVNP